MYYKSKCNCYNCSKQSEKIKPSVIIRNDCKEYDCPKRECSKERKCFKERKCPKNDSCCQFKYLGNVVGKKGDIVEVIPSNDHKIASVQKVVCDKEPKWLWARPAGGINFDIGFGISVDCQGNSYVTGFFSGTATFGDLPPITSMGNNDDIFVVKLDTSGNWLWARSAGGINDDEGLGISVDCQGNSYVTGHFQGTATFGDLPPITSMGNDADIFIAKISSTNLGPLGFLNNYPQPNGLAEVCFPSGVVQENIFNQDLKPGNKYYIDCNCRLSTCCKCAKQFIGLACSKDRMVTGIHDNCCTK